VVQTEFVSGGRGGSLYRQGQDGQQDRNEMTQNGHVMTILVKRGGYVSVKARVAAAGYVRKTGSWTLICRYKIWMRFGHLAGCFVRRQDVCRVLSQHLQGKGFELHASISGPGYGF